MKFAIYSRKSKATDKGESIGNQVEMCRNYINANAPGEEHEFLIYEDEAVIIGLKTLRLKKC